MVAKGEKQSDEEESEDEPTPVVESPRQIEIGDSSKQAEPKVWAGDVAGDGVAREVVGPITSQEDITKD